MGDVRSSYSDWHSIFYDLTACQYFGLMVTLALQKADAHVIETHSFSVAC